jgi:hypothetical protein
MIKKMFGILIVWLLLTGCGELDTLLSSNGTYQVNALVNGNPLEECALIRSGDKIRPYFTHSVASDPDLAGLQVFLENARGEAVGGTVTYTMQAVPETQAETESKPAGEAAQSEAAAEAQAEKAGETQDAPSGGKTAAADPPALDSKTVPAAPEQRDTVVQVKRLDRDIPFFTVPARLAIGTYTLVFQVLGEKETLSRTETALFYLGDAAFSLRDLQLYLPGVSSGSRLVVPGLTVMLEARIDFDVRLDPYIEWYSGKTLVSKGRAADGAGTILWEAPEQTGFHALRAEVFPFENHQGIAGISREIAVPVSAKAVKPRYFFGAAPVHTTRRALEAAARAQAAEADAAPAGEAEQYPEPELIHWYQFGGNFTDAAAPLLTERALIPLSEKTPHWAVADSGYGLSSGDEDAYLFPPAVFFPDGASSGGGQFLFHFKPLADGGIFNAQFAVQPPLKETVELSVVKKGGLLLLILNAPGVPPLEAAAAVPVPVSGSLITAAVDFFIRPARFEAALSLGDDPANQSGAVSVRTLNPLNGSARIRLGGSGYPAPEPWSRQASEQPPAPPPDGDNPAGQPLAETEAGSETAEYPHQLTAVWDECAVLYASMPLLPEEPLAAESESPETESAEETALDAKTPESKPAAENQAKEDRKKAVKQKSKLKKAEKETPEPVSMPTEQEDAAGVPDAAAVVPENA